jgi:tetratricopeptide (TPR) repeat protein
MQFAIALSNTRAKLSGIDMLVPKRVSANGWLMVLLLALIAIPLYAQNADSEAQLRQGDLAVLQGQFDAAKDAYQSAIRAGANLEKDPLRSRNLALCELNAAPPDFVQAIHWFQVALSLDGQNEDTRLQLARTLLRIGRFDQAAEQFRALSSAHPDSTEYAIGLSDSLREGGKTGDALEFLRSTLAKFPENVGLRLEYARLLSYEKMFDPARGQYEAVLRTQPTNLRAQVGIAKIASWQGDQEGALARYNHILERNPSYYDAQVGKAFSLLWMGRATEARPLLEAASRRYPDDQEVREALRTLNGSGTAKYKEPAPPTMAPLHERVSSVAPPSARPLPTNPRLEEIPAKPTGATASQSAPKPALAKATSTAKSVQHTGGSALKNLKADEPSLWERLVDSPLRKVFLLFLGFGLVAVWILSWVYTSKTRTPDTYVHDPKTGRQQHYMPRGGGDEFARLIPTVASHPDAPIDQTSSLSLEALESPNAQAKVSDAENPTVLDLESVFLAAELEAALDASAPDLTEQSPENVAAHVESTPTVDHVRLEATHIETSSDGSDVAEPLKEEIVAPIITPVEAFAKIDLPSFAASERPAAEPAALFSTEREAAAIPAAAYAPTFLNMVDPDPLGLSMPLPPPRSVAHAPESYSSTVPFTIDFEPPQSLTAAFATEMPAEHSMPIVANFEHEVRPEISMEPPVFTALHRASKPVLPPTPEIDPQLLAHPMETSPQSDPRGVLSGKKVLIVGTYDENTDHETRMLRDADADVWIQPSWREGIRFMERVMVDVAILHPAPEDNSTVWEIQSWVAQQRPGFDKKLVFVVSPEERERFTGVRTLVQPFAPDDLLELLVTVH